MKCTIHVYLLNDDFSQEYADERYSGEESELNRKYEWEDELEIKEDIDGFEEFENSIVPLEGTLPNGDEFREEVRGMRVITLTSKGEGVASIACSEKLFHRLESTNENGEMIVRLFLKDREPLSNPIPGVYIAAQDFPKSLVF